MSANPRAPKAPPSPDLNETPDKRSFERLKKVMTRVPLSRPSIYRKVSDGSFPRPINLGGRAVAWLWSDIDAWIDARVKASRDVSPP
jgi:prophage regulatory protein